MVAYLKAGVYWDDSSITEDQMTYSAPTGNGSETVINLHTGLWVKKKSKIENFDSETATECTTDETTFKKLSSLSDSEVKEIRTGGDYFFLPAIGYYYYPFYGGFRDAGSGGGYWSSSPGDDDLACYLGFNNSIASVSNDYRGGGHRPLIAE